MFGPAPVGARKMCRPNTAARHQDSRPQPVAQGHTEAQYHAAACSKAPEKPESQNSSETLFRAKLFAAAALGAPIPPSPAAAAVSALLSAEAAKCRPVPETVDVRTNEPAKPPKAPPKRKRMRHQVSFRSLAMA